MYDIIHIMSGKIEQPKKKLSIRDRKFVRNKVLGMTNAQAYVEAGFKATTKEIANVHGSIKHRKPHIQDAIDEALTKHGLSPEWAVEQLGKVAEQDAEIGAKRLAAKDILELHGWNKSERPTMQLQVKNAFFGNGRQTNQKEVIDVSSTDTE